MKKRNKLFFLMICVAVMGCRNHHRGSTSIEFKNSGRYYSMKASFNENRMRDVEHYMDQVLGDQSNMSFVNSRIEGRLAFNDHTNFYIKKYPGYLQIKIDREQNSEESYVKVQNMCQGIKGVLLQPASDVDTN